MTDTPPVTERREGEECASGCGYTGHDFGAPYPDSTCIDGYLWDLDSCAEPGGGLTQGGDIPCPACNPASQQAAPSNAQAGGGFSASADADTHRTADGRWAELQRLATEATAGPWKACGTIYEHMNCEVRSGAKGEGQGIAQVWEAPNAFRDGQFIAAANPATVLELIAAAEAGSVGIRAADEPSPPINADLLEALRPFDAAYKAYVQAMRNFEVTGGTEAERRFSAGEAEDTASEAAHEALASITFDQMRAVNDALDRAAKAQAEAGR